MLNMASDTKAASPHLTPLTLARLRSGRLETDALARDVVPHLLSLCPGCQAADAELRRLNREVGHWDEEVVATEGPDAPGIWQRFEGMPYTEQLVTVDSDETAHTWALCRLLQRRAQEAANQDQPQLAARLANLALRVAAHLDAAYDPAWVEDLRALSFATLGTARRLLGELAGAADAFDLAHNLCRAGTGDPAVEAQILAQEALLLRDQLRLAEAASLLARAIELAADLALAATDAAELQEWQHAGTVSMVHQAWCAYHQGEIAAALDLLEEAQQRLDPDRSPRLTLAIHSGKVWSGLALRRAGHHFDALADTVTAAFHCSREVGDPADMERLSHAGARLLFLDGARDAAERAWRKLAPSFGLLGLGVDAALVYLDLAALILGNGAAAPAGAIADSGTAGAATAGAATDPAPSGTTTNPATSGLGAASATAAADPATASADSAIAGVTTCPAIATANTDPAIAGAATDSSPAAASSATAAALRDIAAATRALLACPDLGWRGVATLLRFQDACTAKDGLTPELLCQLAQELERCRRPSLAWWSMWGTDLSTKGARHGR